MEMELKNKTAVSLRELRKEDRDSLGKLLLDIPQFTQEEKTCALELIDEYLDEGESSGYDFRIACNESGDLCGFVCFGEISLTQGCYDLYWIVVGPSHQKKGIGHKLMQEVEKVILPKGARKVFIETSSQESYHSTHKFYVSVGYNLAACISDFYKVGDDKIIFVKDIKNNI